MQGAAGLKDRMEALAAATFELDVKLLSVAARQPAFLLPARQLPAALAVAMSPCAMITVPGPGRQVQVGRLFVRTQMVGDAIPTNRAALKRTFCAPPVQRGCSPIFPLG